MANSHWLARGRCPPTALGRTGHSSPRGQIIILTTTAGFHSVRKCSRWRNKGSARGTGLGRNAAYPHKYAAQSLSGLSQKLRRAGHGRGRLPEMEGSSDFAPFLLVSARSPLGFSWFRGDFLEIFSWSLYLRFFSALFFSPSSDSSEWLIRVYTGVLLVPLMLDEVGGFIAFLLVFSSCGF